eukprot:7776017-Alexandrium_andersonii.AAC.1
MPSSDVTPRSSMGGPPLSTGSPRSSSRRAPTCPRSSSCPMPCQSPRGSPSRVRRAAPSGTSEEFDACDLE